MYKGSKRMQFLDSEFFLTVISPVIAGAVGLFYWRIKQRAAVPKYFRQSDKIHDILNEVISETMASRILILKSHNGGGIPSPGRIIKSSCLYEVVGSGVPPVKADWQNQILDRQYLQILSRILESKQWIKTDEMKEGMLRDVYLSSGVCCSVIGRIGHSTRALYYISLNFNKEIPEDQIPLMRNSIRIAVAKLRAFF